jgi:hypothetical protein
LRNSIVPISVRAFFGLLPWALVACATGRYSIAALPVETSNAANGSSLYQPLALRDTWKYACRDIKGGGENGNRPFNLQNSVVGETIAAGKRVYEFSLAVPQVPSKPLRVDTITQLLANDRSGNVRIYGYFIHGKVVRIAPAVFVTAHPPGETHKAFDYRGPRGKIIDRIFFGLEQSNKTKFGTFEVAPYFESHSTHDYGYAKGWGIVEEDHGPNYEVDCLITAIKLH